MLRQSSFFQYDNSTVTEFPLSRQYFVHSSNSSVATSITMSQLCFSATSASWCRDPSFYVATASLFRLCCNIVLYYLHFCRDPKSLSRQRLVTTMQLSQLSSDVKTWLLGVVNICYRDKTLLCSTYLFCRDPVCYVTIELLFIMLNSFSQPRKVCRYLVSLRSVYFYVATLRSMSRHKLISSA